MTLAYQIGVNFSDHWPHYARACLLQVHLHEKSVGGMNVAALGRLVLNRGDHLNRLDCIMMRYYYNV